MGTSSASLPARTGSRKRRWREWIPTWDYPCVRREGATPQSRPVRHAVVRCTHGSVGITAGDGRRESAETTLKTRAKRRDRASLSNKKPDFSRVPPAAPVFPLSYVITVHFKDGTSQSVSRSITTFETAR